MMNSFKIIDSHRSQFYIDTNIFSKSVISKVLYWLNQDFVVMSSSNDGSLLINLESINEVDWESEKMKISILFNDFQLREQIEKETHDIRNILYIKAFSNIDNFTEYETEG